MIHYSLTLATKLVAFKAVGAISEKDVFEQKYQSKSTNS